MKAQLLAVAVTLLSGCGGAQDGACVFHGTVETKAQLDALLACKTIDGQKGLEVLNVDGVTTLEFKNLTRVSRAGGSGNDQTGISLNGLRDLESVSFPALTETSGLDLSNNPRLTAVSAPALANIRGRVNFYENATLTRIDLPALQTIAAGFYVTQCPALATLDLGALVGGPHPEAAYVELSIDGSALTAVRAPSLQKAVSIKLTNNAAATTFSFPLLEELGLQGFEATRNAALTAVELPALKTTGALTVSENDTLASLTLSGPLLDAGRVQVSFNPKLAALEVANATTVSNLSVQGNAVLTRLRFPSLMTLGGGTISGNPMLPDCEAKPLTTLAGAQLLAFQNLGDGCP